MKLNRLILLGVVSLLFAFAPYKRNILKKLLQQHKQELAPVLVNPNEYKVQLIYTQIDRNEKNIPQFKSFEYRIDDQLYFYPASVVKMPTAVLALEKLRNTKIIGLTPDATMINGKGSDPQTFVEFDATSRNGRPSLYHYIRKIFLVSDNDAYNRLYEYLGQNELNRALQSHGFDNFRIIHRLSAPEFNPIENQYTNPVSFLNGETLLYYQGEVHSSWNHSDMKLKGQMQGLGFINNEGDLVNNSFDFSQKNFISLRTVNEILKTLLFPEILPESQRFNLTKVDYELLYQWMSMLPRESNYPKYTDLEKYPDNYVKFWMYGDRSEKIPSSLRIYNKVGFAYGYLTDVSYIVDFEKKIEFMMAGTIFVNKNQVFNDGQYEYEAIGMPFFGKLGRIIYNYECIRKRKHVPDLSKFKPS